MAEHAGGGDDDIEELREQDRFLPIANISRLVKKRLPDNAKVAKDAKETTQVSAYAFLRDLEQNCRTLARAPVAGVLRTSNCQAAVDTAVLLALFVAYDMHRISLTSIVDREASFSRSYSLGRALTCSAS